MNLLILTEGNTFYFEWEIKLIEWIQSWLGSFGAFLATFFTLFGEQLAMVAVLGFMYWCFDKKTGKRIALTFFLAMNLVNMAKNIAFRKRPYMVDSNIKCLKKVDASADIMDVKSQGYSFPSGHSTNASSVYSTIAYNYKKRWLTIICYSAIVLVCISRFCLGVHFPTDVIAGAALGILCMILTNVLFKYIKKEWIIYLIFAVAALPGFFFCKSNDYFTSIGMMYGGFLGLLFEKKYVNFENTKSIFEIIIRMLIGVGLYFGLNALFKLPFNKEWLESTAYLAFIVRTLRYTAILFILCAIYPMSFKLIHKINPFNKEK